MSFLVFVQDADLLTLRSEPHGVLGELPHTVIDIAQEHN